jgi:hypothetical protein
MSTTVVPGSAGPVPNPDPDTGSKDTMAQAFLVVGLTVPVLGFTGWMIAQGYQPHVALLTASGGVAIAGGLTFLRGLKRLARVWGQS